MLALLFQLNLQADQAALAAQDAVDSATLVGQVVDPATLAANDNADAAAAAAAAAEGGAFSVSEQPDAAMFSGAVIDQGGLSAQEQADSASWSASIFDQGALAAQDAPDKAAAAGAAGSVDVWMLPMWTVAAGIMPGDDLLIGPINFFEADGVTPIDLPGISFTAKIGSVVLTSAAGQIVVNGNALTIAAMAGSVTWGRGRFGFSLLAFNGVKTHSIFANSTLTIGSLSSVTIRPFGSVLSPIKVINRPAV